MSNQAGYNSIAGYGYTPDWPAQDYYAHPTGEVSRLPCVGQPSSLAQFQTRAMLNYLGRDSLPQDINGGPNPVLGTGSDSPEAMREAFIHANWKMSMNGYRQAAHGENGPSVGGSVADIKRSVNMLPEIRLDGEYPEQNPTYLSNYVANKEFARYQYGYQGLPANYGMNLAGDKRATLIKGRAGEVFIKSSQPPLAPQGRYSGWQVESLR